jgi:hypothetical protein
LNGPRNATFVLMSSCSEGTIPGVVAMLLSVRELKSNLTPSSDTALDQREIKVSETGEKILLECSHRLMATALFAFVVTRLVCQKKGAQRAVWLRLSLGMFLATGRSAPLSRCSTELRLLEAASRDPAQGWNRRTRHSLVLYCVLCSCPGGGLVSKVLTPSHRHRTTLPMNGMFTTHTITFRLA